VAYRSGKVNRSNTGIYGGLLLEAINERWYGLKSMPLLLLSKIVAKEIE